MINLGSDAPVKLMDLVGLVEEMVGRPARLEYRLRHPADVSSTWADIGKAGQLLAWQPQITLRDGLAALVDWYRSERSWAVRCKYNRMRE